MDPRLRLISAAYLSAILERAGMLGNLQVQDVTIISDRPTLMSRIIPTAASNMTARQTPCRAA
jgi:hypothetical protein